MRYCLILLCLLLGLPLLAAPPKTWSIVPGVGLGPFKVGTAQKELQKTLAAEGVKFANQTMDKGARWSCPAGADEEKFAFLFDAAKGPVDQVAIYSPEFSVQGHDGIRVSCSHEAVLKEFPKPSKDLGGWVDYNELGLYFYFNSRSSRELPKYGPGMCEAIIVYTPGRSTWTK